MSFKLGKAPLVHSCHAAVPLQSFKLAKKTFSEGQNVTLWISEAKSCNGLSSTPLMLALSQTQSATSVLINPLPSPWQRCYLCIQKDWSYDCQSYRLRKLKSLSLVLSTHIIYIFQHIIRFDLNGTRHEGNTITNYLKTAYTLQSSIKLFTIIEKCILLEAMGQRAFLNH